MTSWRRARRLALVANTTVAVVLGLVVVAVAVGVAALVAGELPGSGWSVATTVAAAVTAAALWSPAQRAGRRAVEHLVHGGRADPDAVVRAVGRRSAGDLSDDDLLGQVAESLLRGFRAASAAIWLTAADGRLRRTVAIPSREAAAIELDERAQRILEGGGVVGRSWLETWSPSLLADLPAGEVRVAPATHGGTLLGLVVVARLPGAERFAADADASLAELGTRLGVLLHNRALDATLREALEDLRRTNAELRASRGRLVTAADAERRRIERDLHDGAQQHLVALAVNLRLAAAEVAAAPESAAGVFDALGDDVRAAITELRALAHGIYPPLLMDAGLVEALTVSARRSPSAVRVVADAGVGRYPTEIEAAVYFCCMEALQNAAKHAPDAAVEVRLADDGTHLTFDVVDDGPGFDGAAPHLGRGLENMADRVGAVGGSLRVGPGDAGGTTVHGEVPVTLGESGEAR